MSVVEVTCPKCKKKDVRDNMHKVVIKNVRYYCDTCIVTEAEEIEKKQKELNKKPLSVKDRDTQELAELIDYICILYNVSRPSGMVLKQIKDFKKDYDFRYKGMELALRYFHELEGNSLHDSGGVGIIPYVYERAKEFHLLKNRAKRSSIDDAPTQVIERKVRPKEKNKRRLGIDLNDI